MNKENKIFYNMILQEIFEVATDKELKFPDVIAQLGAAQSCLETGYGQHHPDNNYFGIKGKGNINETKEFINGKWVTISAAFQGYINMNDSALGYVEFLIKNPRYHNVLNAANIDAAITAIGQSGYATDPHYTTKLHQIHNSITV